MSSKLSYLSPARLWTEALPLGNGSLGAMVFGGKSHERLALNHDTLWSGLPKEIKKPGAYDAFIEGRKLALAGEYTEAHRVISEGFLGENCENYLPLGDMTLDIAGIENVTDYRRELDLERAVLTVSYKANGASYKRECFISYPDDIAVIRLTTDAENGMDFTVGLTSQLKYEIKHDGDTYILDGECPGYSHADDPKNIQIYEYSDEPEKKGIRFRTGIKVVTSGKTVFTGTHIKTENASEALILLAVKTSFNGYDKHPVLEGKEYKEPLANVLSDAESKGYASLLESHLADYSELYSRISLDLGTSGREDMPTDERLKLFETDKNDISLYTLLFDFGRYLMIASSRKGTQATNLQGIWNSSLTPPWRCDYTTNINTEMNYFPTLMCGLEECTEPLVRFMKDRCEAGKATASHYYNARGFVIHHNSDIWAHTTAVTSNAQWGFWNGASGWLCHNLFDIYEYTLDKEYLEKTCFPIMKEAALFYLDLLCERGDGKRSVVPMTSPENMFIAPDGGRSAVAKYTTMSDSIAYELFGNCLKAIDILGGEESFKAELDAALASMSPFALDSRGRLMEWNEEFGETEVTHRHISHLYALHPAHLITPEKTPALAEACRKTMDVRGDAGTGWSLGWKINFRARLGDGDRALKLLDMQLHYVEPEIGDFRHPGGTYPNLFDAHPPFQIDGNFGAVSGIIEMIVDTRDGELVLLPALPSAWKSGSLRGVRVKGGKILDIEWEDGKLKQYVINDA